ncbi:hypothetical protein [Streptomyces qinglanensis]|uniref:Uncharacterized protein n=1 Tax=Streptomyces qinglanensis TaxID=943816 RepID=A0A1H9U375_9ACTN|nr:hypothetical protein [Streptomyces qinglanensis]SES03752.1 hypothetical protein SAMN05421870_107269 [Streptomyces qinglanensis]
MAYQYRCDDCGTTAEPVHSRVALRAVRGRHRQLAHHGLRPDGEHIETVGVRQRLSWRTGCGFAVLAWIAVLDWIIRHL